MSVSNFYNSCVSDAMVQKPSFDCYSFKSSSFTNSVSQLSFCHSKFSSPKIPTTLKSSISGSPTKCNNFSFLIPSVIKSNGSKPACGPPQTSRLLSFPINSSRHPQTSRLLSFPINSSRHLFQSSTQACQ